ncbi:DUF2303 family protein [Bordetella flabilis]|uniref:DUF2303 domain-containing protein n=1 Tax=Bordetella flabilis TaxID=463014 RepID=A0A193GI27_9BORD|nr:DUF2303 family protein [Bordetella flabilis]ANN78929.1 hypothetical protein BAU07_19000 [Bordetella flabilis]
MPNPNGELTSIADPNIAETAARLAQRPEEIAETDFGRLFAVPHGYRLETDVALAALAATPPRKRGTVQLRTVDSFVQYVLQHKEPQTQIYVKVDAANAATPLIVTAVFNDHEFGAPDTSPGWQDFRAVFTPAASPEWKTWMGKNGEKMSQVEFASFIEDNIHCFAGSDTDGGAGFPTGGEMLQMALAFEASSDKRIRSNVRLQSGGIQLEYTDKDDDATVTRMQAFERFRLGLAPFWRGDAYPLEAKLRYRQASGTLALWYDLVRPDRLVDHAVDEVLAQIGEKTGITPLFGTLGQ